MAAGQATATINITESTKGGVADYTASAGSIASISIDRDSGPYVTLTIVAGASGLTLNNLRMRAVPVSVVRSHNIVYPVGATVPEGQKYKPNIRPEIALADGQAYAQEFVTFYQYPRATCTLTVITPIKDAGLANMLAVEISDRVRITETQSGLSNEDFFVEQIEQETRNLLMITKLGLERAA